jgi:hypothetical protein
MEAFFEQNPWLLVPIIIVTVEGWTFLKKLAVHLMRRRSADRILPPN